MLIIEKDLNVYRNFCVVLSCIFDNKSVSFTKEKETNI